MSEILEIVAEHLHCGDRVRRGHRVYQVDRVEITHRSPVRLVVHRTNGAERAPANEDLILPIGEIIQRVEA